MWCCWTSLNDNSAPTHGRHAQDFGPPECSKARRVSRFARLLSLRARISTERVRVQEYHLARIAALFIHLDEESATRPHGFQPVLSFEIHFNG
jgi:hypothetical protein